MADIFYTVGERRLVTDCVPMNLSCCVFLFFFKFKMRTISAVIQLS